MGPGNRLEHGGGGGKDGGGEVVSSLGREVYGETEEGKRQLKEPKHLQKVKILKSTPGRTSAREGERLGTGDKNKVR